MAIANFSFFFFRFDIKLYYSAVTFQGNKNIFRNNNIWKV